MLDQDTIRKKTLFVFYIVNILSGLGGLFAAYRNGVLFLSPSVIAQSITVGLSILSSYFIVRTKRYKLIRNISFFAYTVISVMMWYTLGGANQIFILYALFFIVVILNTISSRRRILISLFTLSVAILLVYIDRVYRAGDLSLSIFSSAQISGLVFIAPGIWFIITYQLFFVDKMIADLSKFSYRDQMSGAKNRRALYKDFDVYKKKKTVFSIVYIDINKLKYINDNFGHLYGDLAIIGVIKNIEEVFKDKADIYRLGGDEFAMIVHKMPEQEICNTLNSIECEIKKEDVEFKVTFSYGLLKHNGDQMLSELLVSADKKMYVSKNINSSLNYS